MCKSITCRVGIWKLKIIDDVHKFADEVWQGVEECLPQDEFPTASTAFEGTWSSFAVKSKYKCFLRFGVIFESGLPSGNLHVLEDISERKKLALEQMWRVKALGFGCHRVKTIKACQWPTITLIPLFVSFCWKKLKQNAESFRQVVVGKYIAKVMLKAVRLCLKCLW